MIKPLYLNDPNRYEALLKHIQGIVTGIQSDETKVAWIAALLNSSEH